MTRLYAYRLLDRRERELLVYHWQPGPRYAGPDHPHLHVSASLRVATSAVDEREIDLEKLHLQTGHVGLAALVRSLITEFGVEPIRPDWSRELDGAEAAELAAFGRSDCPEPPSPQSTGSTTEPSVCPVSRRYVSTTWSSLIDAMQSATWRLSVAVEGFFSRTIRSRSPIGKTVISPSSCMNFAR